MVANASSIAFALVAVVVVVASVNYRFKCFEEFKLTPIDTYIC